LKFDDVFTNVCPVCNGNGPLVKADYEAKVLEPLQVPGFWKFLQWLPCENLNPRFDSGTIVYKSKALARELGLKNLFIAFNGYWPEKNAGLFTCTFKELEAPPTFQRAEEKCINSLVIASAGNTAKAFIFAAQHFDVRLYVVIPKDNINRLKLPFKPTENVTVIATKKGSDYTDSIMFARRMTDELKIMNEGGARNVARRDGMGTVMLESVLYMNRLPDHYFQAVGSGTGAIATMEALERLLQDGSYPGTIPQLHLSQNHPFTPLVNAWNLGSKELLHADEAQQRAAIIGVFAKVLTNRHPPYSIGGGIYDILKASNGLMYGVTNNEALSAFKLFEGTEGIDLVPASCVAVGSLVTTVESGKVKPKDFILLNITGAGETRLWEDYAKHKVKPDITCDPKQDMAKLKKELSEMSV
jgi:cysteate synthase